MEGGDQFNSVPIKEFVQSVNESIRVLASFSENKIKIHYFNWRDRLYKVDSMNLFHIGQDGDKKHYHFAVSASGNSYQIVYDPVTLHWQLEEVVQL
jgi:hypothetical protein